MLHAENRLHKRKEFAFIYKNGKCVFGKYLNLVFNNSKLPNVKVGFSVSKKIGKAHIRNKVKRQLRAIVRELLPNFSTNKNYIFIAKPEIDKLTFMEIKQEVCFVLKKSGVCNECV